MNRQLTALFYGSTIIVTLMFIFSLGLAILLRFTTFNEPLFSFISFATGFLCLFSGGLVAGLKGKQKGWLIGLTTGITFLFFVFLFQYLGLKQSISLDQLLYFSSCLFASILGGIIGVNMNINPKK